MCVAAIYCVLPMNTIIDYVNHEKFLLETKKYEIEISENLITVNGSKIILFRERDPTKIDWTKADVNYIIDSTGAFKSLEKASKHFISKSVKKVIITAPSEDAPMYVVGVNSDKYDSSQKVVSNSSCTTNCLAPIAKVINDYFGIEEGFISTIHSITSSQNTLDGRASKNIRIGLYKFFIIWVIYSVIIIRTNY